MKISKEHFEHIKQEIEKVVNQIPELEKQYIDAGYTYKRFRWDMLHRAKLSPWICDNLYRYGCNDEHIDTVLRKIFNHKF
jgi:hypothetical protein